MITHHLKLAQVILMGAMQQTVTLFIEVNDMDEVRSALDEEGYNDYKIVSIIILETQLILKS